MPSPTPATPGPIGQRVSVGLSQTNGPLSAEHHTQIAQAQQRRKKLNRAGKIASFNAWSFAVLAGLSVPFALLSPSSLIGAAALGVLAWNEFRGRRHLRQLDPRGPMTLGYNQLAFCGLITLYCGYQIFKAMTGPGLYAESMDATPQLAEMLGPMQELIKTATISAYALMLIAGVAVQGGTAWYYFSRKRWLQDYLRQTPQWVIDLDRTQASAPA